jgi:hypothetical protein
VSNAGRFEFPVDRRTGRGRGSGVQLCPACSAENPDEFRHCGYCTASLAAPEAGRRRLATLVFSDVVGSTALGEHVDAESVQELLRLYFAEMRAALARHDPAFADAALADAFVATLGAGGIVAREATSVRLPTHGVSTAGSVEADRMVAAVTNAGTAPPTVRELTAAGYDLELIGAVCAEGRLVRVAPDLVMTPSIIERALELIRTAGPNGMTVSDVRQALGTSRKYAVPLLEHLDARGLTRRVGDVRVARG